MPTPTAMFEVAGRAIVLRRGEHAGATEPKISRSPDPAPPPLRRLPRVAARSGLTLFIAVSIGAHVAAGLLAWPWALPASPPAEVPATIQVLFGDNADAAGAPAQAAPAPPPDVAAGTSSLPPAAVAEPSAAAAAGGAAPPAAPLPVRLGEGDIGLKLTDPPDAGMIEAQADPGNRAPKYPEIAWRQHEYGRVVIRMHIDTAGRVSEAEVLESSGHPALDRAAREALARWHFIPALQDGAAVPSFRDQATNFVLR